MTEVPTGRVVRRRRREMSLGRGPSIAFRVRKPTEFDRVAIRRSGALRIRDVRPPPPAPSPPPMTPPPRHRHPAASPPAHPAGRRILRHSILRLARRRPPRDNAYT